MENLELAKLSQPVRLYANLCEYGTDCVLKNVLQALPTVLSWSLRVAT